MPAAAPGQAQRTSDQAVTTLYSKQYGALVRQAVLLLGDVAAAEEVVQDSFVALHGARHRLRNEDEAVSYLRRSVVNRSRSVLRQRVANRRFPALLPDAATVGEGRLSQAETLMIIAAISMITPRQREALVLKYYLDLPEAEIASAMGISKRAVKTHIARAIASLRTAPVNG